jgi:glycosyltransferase involved in cell wall biosynthesis
MSDMVKYLIITPVRDEARHIEKTIASVTEQTVRPRQWIIVDDGSTDGTSEVLDRAAQVMPWITVVHRANRGHRLPGGGVMEAFYAGYDVASIDDWEFVVKLDGDLSFAPSYFETCFAKFHEDSKLGIGGGTVCQLEEDNLVVDARGDPAFHVRGATKIYRRECWLQVAPLVRGPGWDTIDEVKANRHGWTTRTFSDLTLIQHKPTGGADGSWRDAYKNGRANYMTGYHPAFMVAKCVKRLSARPLVIQSLALLLGYCSGYVKRLPQGVDQDTREYLRQQQLNRLLCRRSIYG